VWDEDKLPFRSRYDAVGDHAVVQSLRVWVSVSLRPSARRERSSRIPPFKCSENVSPVLVLWRYVLTECLQEIFSALYSHPPIGGVWVYHSMIYLDAFPIRLLVPGKILQPLPRACPRQARNDDIIHACNVPSWNVRHLHARLSTTMLRLGATSAIV
jgi:hypothetical protein